MKVLSCKIEEEFYNIINSLEKSNSDILRMLIYSYVKSLQKPNKKTGKRGVYAKQQGYDYNTIKQQVDKLIDQNKDFFNNSNKKECEK